MPTPIEEKLNSLDDQEILAHGEVDHLRDYELRVNRPDGLFLYRFTHCVAVEITTMLRDDTWVKSWEDMYTEPQWNDDWGPDHYHWVKFAVAYPAPVYLTGSPRASEWKSRLGKAMHEAAIETNVYRITLVFHDLTITRIGDYIDIGLRIPLSP
jgi:hypothetical protein